MATRRARRGCLDGCDGGAEVSWAAEFLVGSYGLAVELRVGVAKCVSGRGL